jgi:hypothetical protein
MDEKMACAEEALLSIAIDALNAMRKIRKGPVDSTNLPLTSLSTGPGMDDLLKSFDVALPARSNGGYPTDTTGCLNQPAAPQPKVAQKRISTRIISGKIQSLLPQDGSPMPLSRIVDELRRSGDIPDTSKRTSSYVSVALTTLKKSGLVGNGPGYKIGWRLIKKEAAAVVTVPTPANPVSQNNA